ncbi:hypothetical protein TTHERM_000277125 (macronuclear) [Tetrahymena thermophila SB210]|uniref:Uncharacterized protein n=1 Tax=Tetrahymena thermophila (strain SB210) TaxID=312017 RepID=W7X3G8_TETTS|nr:hypothetical protein TTHERM_000277125 [Tetrahymena thermophila SB210]EWS73835.1 hypothetical protein TTHERM_000277125 [Tetrahymena thermophila SB210]|eukprot:XP_012653582.1 hypothetical protein TTHERM_000277125 [Tetrahymena thermophila SB210]
MDTQNNANEWSFLDQNQYQNYILILEDGVMKDYQYTFYELHTKDQFIYEIIHQKTQKNILESLFKRNEEKINPDKSNINLVSLIQIIFQNYLFSNDKKTKEYFCKYVTYIENTFQSLQDVQNYKNVKFVDKLYQKIQERNKNNDYIPKKQKQLQNYISDLNLLMQKNIFSLIHLQNLMSQPNQFIKYQMVAIQYYTFQKIESKIKLTDNLHFFKEKFNANIAIENLKEDKIFNNFKEKNKYYFQIQAENKYQKVQYSGSRKEILNTLVESCFNRKLSPLYIDEIGHQISIPVSNQQYSKIQAIQFTNPIEAFQVFFFLMFFDSNNDKSSYIDQLKQCLYETTIFNYIEIKDTKDFNNKENFQMKDFIDKLQDQQFIKNKENLLKLAQNKYFRLLIMQFYIYLIRKQQKLHLLFTKINNSEQLQSIFRILTESFKENNLIQKLLITDLNSRNNQIEQTFSFYFCQNSQYKNQDNQFFILLPNSMLSQSNQQIQMFQSIRQSLLQQIQANPLQICIKCNKNIVNIFYQNYFVCDICFKKKFLSYI